MKLLGNSQSGAVFSDCMKYRYRLWRCWDPTGLRACFIMLNPSTADEIENDPTIERQQRRVQHWKMLGREFGSIEIVNAFAYRSTDPKVLFTVMNAVGAMNDTCIEDAVRASDIIVCGWGSHAMRWQRHYRLIDLLERIEEATVTAFKLNADGTPQHPLYLSYDLDPHHWMGGELHERAID